MVGDPIPVREFAGRVFDAIIVGDRVVCFVDVQGRSVIEVHGEVGSICGDYRNAVCTTIHKAVMQRVGEALWRLSFLYCDGMAALEFRGTDKPIVRSSPFDGVLVLRSVQDFSHTYESKTELGRRLVELRKKIVAKYGYREEAGDE